MPQLFLDPRNTDFAGTWKPYGPIDRGVREFGFFPDINNWFPGDLLLVSSIKPRWISSQIIKAQERGGYSGKDAIWHHAALYLGEGSICEASARGVHVQDMFSYIGTHLLRLRRDPQLKADDRYRLAMYALFRLRQSYSFRTIVQLFFWSFSGYWKDSEMAVYPFGIGAVICSELYANAYSMATSKLICNPFPRFVVPAALSMTSTLEDVPIRWRKIA